MNKELFKVISQYTEIDEALEEVINESTFVRNYKRGTVLTEAGKPSDECYFVLKGCIRCYFFKDGTERTTEFYTEGQAVVLSSYGKNTPSKHFLQCTEDTIACIGTPELEKQMFEKYPQLQKLGHVMAEAMMTQANDAFGEFKTASPEERYMALLKRRPDLFQRVPLHQIASYLGITAESLSRIRKRQLSK